MKTSCKMDNLLHKLRQRRSFNAYSPAGNIIAARQYCSSSNHQGEHVAYLSDIRGSITSIVDGNMNFIQGYRYTDYGITTRIGSGAFNEFAYTQGIWDSTTGLYYLNARFYNPVDGRFLTQDPYRGSSDQPDTWHLYGYCAGDPINWIDPTGHWRTHARLTALSLRYPRQGGIIIGVGAVAHTEGRRSVWTGQHHGNEDAFRHALWNAEGVRLLFQSDPWRHFGNAARRNSLNRAVRITNTFTTANEPRGRETGANWSATRMDLFNNARGRTLGRVGNSTNRTTMIRQTNRLVFRGELRVLQHRPGTWLHERGRLVRSGAHMQSRFSR